MTNIIRVCPECGARVDEDERECQSCGQLLEKPRRYRRGDGSSGDAGQSAVLSERSLFNLGFYVGLGFCSALFLFSIATAIVVALLFGLFGK